MSSFTDPLRLEDNGDETFTVIGQFRYFLNNNSEIVIPSGFITDFASVPRAFWSLIPPYGKHGKAAVVHDYLYSTKGLLGNYSRQRCDEIFLEAMTVLNVTWTRRHIMYQAVRRFGWSVWNRKGIAPTIDNELNLR